MSLRPWKKIAEETVSANPWWVYKKDRCTLPSGEEGEYHYVHTNGSSMVIPVTNEGKILMVNQYRYLVSRESLEFPCGSVKGGSTHDQTAWEELVEETGYSAKELLCVGEFNPYNGVTDEMCRVYVARDLRYVGGIPDQTEEFQLHTVASGELGSLIANGTIWDGMTLAAWMIARPSNTLGGTS